MHFTSILIASLLLSVFMACGPGSAIDNEWSVKDYPNVRIQFVDYEVGFIVGPRLIRTVDAGNSWLITEYQRIEDALRAEGNLESYTHDVQFIDRDWGWRLSQFDKNAVEWTADSGHTWSPPISFGPNVYQRSLVFVSRDRGWVLGEQKVVKTNNRGKDWIAEESLTGLSLQLPTFLDSNHIWLASKQGVIARTVDGGEHWSINHDLPKNVTSIFFITPLMGWLVGEAGLIARTEDGGVHWLKQDISLPYDHNRKASTTLMDVFFINSERGWICGDDGLVLGTTDSGRTWTTTMNTTRGKLVSIRFVDPSRGWAVGGFPEPSLPTMRPSNVVVETTDGGKTWKTKVFK